jgi:hypothetical protein
LSNCPDCRRPMANVRVQITGPDGLTVFKEFTGLLCGECRKIWSPTSIDGSIDMRLLT